MRQQYRKCLGGWLPLLALVLAAASSMFAQTPVTIRGQVVADSHRHADMMEVRMEGQGSELVGIAYTDGSGEFAFRDVMIQPDRVYYIVVNAKGYRPVRESLHYGMNVSYGGRITIFLESETAAPAVSEGLPVVGLKQLQAKIPGKAKNEYRKALEESMKGNYAKATERLETATRLAPDFYEAQNNLGVQYVKARRYPEAETAFERARELNPGAAEPLLNLGSLFYQKGESQSGTGKTQEAAESFTKAVEFLSEAIRRSPGSARAYQYLGAALYRTASYERAESVLRRALQLDSTSGDVHLILINVYARQNRLGEALQEMATYLENNPASPHRFALEQMKKQIERMRGPATPLALETEAVR